MKKLSVFVLWVAVITVLLTGCLNREKLTELDLAKQAIETEVNADFQLIEVALGNYTLQTISDGAIDEPAGPVEADSASLVLSLDYYGEYDVDIDLTAGVATYVLVLSGGVKADLSKDGQPQGSKEAPLSGYATYSLQKVDNKWEIVKRDFIYSTKSSKLVIEKPQITPNPVAKGSTYTVNATIYNALPGSDIRAFLISCKLIQTQATLYDYNLTRFIPVGDKLYSASDIQIPADFSHNQDSPVIEAFSWDKLADLSKDASGNLYVPIELTMRAFYVNFY